MRSLLCMEPPPSEACPVSSEDLRQVARERFGIRRFRPGQEALIQAVLRGEDVLGVLPTGAGKSLTYQLPALYLPGLVVVVSPLISLMQDQHEKLSEQDIPAARLDSTLSASEEKEVRRAVRRNRAEVLFVTPERLENPEFLSLLKKQQVSLFVVDEAHCVSQWGHDFRPAFLSLRDAARELGRPPILALTATAPADVRDEIIRELGMRDVRLVTTGVERPNLFFEVLPTPRRGDKRAALLRLVRESGGTGIIYVATVRHANELHRWLLSEGVNAALYHGRRKASEREETQRTFMEDGYQVLVATNAFGMGIDKPDVRFVAHYQFPGSLEAYYQEAGRAGRDGKPARATLLYRLEDRRIQSFFLGGKYPRRHESWALLHALGAQLGPETEGGVPLSVLQSTVDLPERRVKVMLAHLEGAGIVRRRRGKVQVLRGFESADALTEYLEAYERRFDTDRERLQAMMHYAQATRCRTQLLREAFDEPSSTECGHCDNCERVVSSARQLPDAEPPGTLSEDRLAQLAASVTGERTSRPPGT